MSVAVGAETVVDEAATLDGDARPRAAVVAVPPQVDGTQRPSAIPAGLVPAGSCPNQPATDPRDQAQLKSRESRHLTSTESE